jgi:hypothetical protein
LRKEKSFMSAPSAFDEKEDGFPLLARRCVHGTSFRQLGLRPLLSAPSMRGRRQQHVSSQEARSQTGHHDTVGRSQRTRGRARQANDGTTDGAGARPDRYVLLHSYWLLDNPDRAVAAWRRLGAKCVSIQRRGPAKFGYVDEAGSDVTWETIHQGPGVRIWFAEGKVKPSPVLPVVPVKAMVILRSAEGKARDGVVMVQHHAEVVIHTDSKAAAGVTKLMGQSASKLAEQGLSQLQLFFSALSFYADRHPEHVEKLFSPEK